MNDLQGRFFVAVLDLGDVRTVHFRGAHRASAMHLRHRLFSFLDLPEIGPLTIQRLFSSPQDLIHRELPVFNQTPGKLNVRLKAKNRLG